MLIFAEIMCYVKGRCKNGGTCQEDMPARSYTCECPIMYEGKHCESSKYRYNLHYISLYSLTIQTNTKYVQCLCINAKHNKVRITQNQ